MVPGEGFEPPTFGLQNRCTATVLTRPPKSDPVYRIPLFDGEKQLKRLFGLYFGAKLGLPSG